MTRLISFIPPTPAGMSIVLGHSVPKLTFSLPYAIISIPKADFTTRFQITYLPQLPSGRCQRRMKMYTIGQVSEMFGLPISTLRYYDKEGLFPDIKRSSGIRRFSEKELECLRIIECLKKSGLEIKDIKQFMEWCAQGSETYLLRKGLFLKQFIHVEEEIKRLNQVRDMLRYKCWYYDEAIRNGNEDWLHSSPQPLPSPEYDPLH